MQRSDPQLQVDELTSLVQFLDYHRTTFLSRIEGLDHEQANRRLASSDLTIASLAKHLAFVEDSWFQDDFLGQPMPAPWIDAPFDDDPDWELHSAGDDSPDELIALYRAACDRSRAAVASAASLDALSNRLSSDGEAFSLRWIMLHLIEETARHNGHADLIRESIDGLVGE